jgi:L-ascorbate metabolism protein UlaG (beta-lactamase superfamily)
VIEPFLKDEAFLADVAAARKRQDAIHIWWLGQSGFLIHSGGACLLVDPYLSDSLTTKYAATDKPHVRMTARVIAPERLDFIDIVTSSHNHTDHLDADTLLPLRAANPSLQIVIPAANRAFVADRLNTDPNWPIGLNYGERITLSEFEFIAVPAAHEKVEPQFLGLIVRTRGLSIYHSGDTILYEGMAERLMPFKLDLALLPINGAKPERRVAGNLNGAEAAQLARRVGAKCVVPCHYEMFEFNTASPDEFVAEANRLRQPYRLLRAGERMDLP